MSTLTDKIAAVAAVCILAIGLAYAWVEAPTSEHIACTRIGGSLDLMGDCSR